MIYVLIHVINFCTYKQTSNGFSVIYVCKVAKLLYTSEHCAIKAVASVLLQSEIIAQRLLPLLHSALRYTGAWPPCNCIRI